MKNLVTTYYFKTDKKESIYKRYVSESFQELKKDLKVPLWNDVCC